MSLFEHWGRSENGGECWVSLSGVFLCRRIERSIDRHLRAPSCVLRSVIWEKKAANWMIFDAICWCSSAIFDWVLLSLTKTRLIEFIRWGIDLKEVDFPLPDNAKTRVEAEISICLGSMTPCIFQPCESLWFLRMRTSSRGRTFLPWTSSDSVLLLQEAAYFQQIA